MPSINVFIAPSSDDSSFLDAAETALFASRGWHVHGVDVTLCKEERTESNTSDQAPGVNLRLGSKEEMGDLCSAHPHVCDMNVCYAVKQSRLAEFPVLSEIRVHPTRWHHGPVYGYSAFPGFTEEAYRAYIVQHELGHALGLWDHTDVTSWAQSVASRKPLLMNTKELQNSLAWSRPGLIPASIMTQQSVEIPEGLCPCPVVHAYDVSRLMLLHRE